MTDQILLDSILRSFLIASAAVMAGVFFFSLIHRRICRPVWLLAPLFLCFFIPPVAVAYGYSNLSYSLIQNPTSLKTLYILIMTCRLAGPVTILLIFLPGGISDESVHCYSLLQQFTPGRKSFIKPFLFKLQSTHWRYFLAFFLVFMLAFSEFEIASLLNIPNWSVSLFDSYSQGISGLSAFKLHIIPFLMQAILLFIFMTLLPLLGNYELIRSDIENPHSVCSGDGKLKNIIRLESFFFFALISSFIFVGVIYPLFVIVKSAIPGFSMLFQRFWMYKELLSSFLFAGTASIAAYLISYILSRLFKKNTKLLLMFCFAPFLIGILPVSMIIIEVFKYPPFSMFYGTPAPLLIALTVYCIPFVLILHLVFSAFTSDGTLHSSRLLLPFSKQKAMELLWESKFRGAFWIFFFIFTLAFFDLTASAMLAPTSMPTITARFYNLMHYGESEKLSATVCVSIILPLLLFTIIVLVFRTLLKKWNAFSRI